MASADIWINAGWECIKEFPLSAPLNLAIDQVLIEAVAHNRRPPTLRFWGWDQKAVVLGRFQSVRNEVDVEAAQDMGVAIVRRLSGGGAMFVEPQRTITYSLYLPPVFLEGLSLRDSYERCDRWVVDYFRRLGMEAWYQPLNDITSSQGKLGGAAQARKPGVILHHTTVAYEMDSTDMLRVLRIGKARLSEKGVPSAAKVVFPLRRQTNLSREEVVEGLTQFFMGLYGLKETALTQAEWDQARSLAQDKYSSHDWIHDLP